MDSLLVCFDFFHACEDASHYSFIVGCLKVHVPQRSEVFQLEFINSGSSNDALNRG